MSTLGQPESPSSPASKQCLLAEGRKVEWGPAVVCWALRAFGCIVQSMDGLLVLSSELFARSPHSVVDAFRCHLTMDESRMVPHQAQTITTLDGPCPVSERFTRQ